MKILFVCLGNICRSPIADGVMRAIVKNEHLDWEINSAGTGSWHVNEAPDKRAQSISKYYGTDISSLKARQFKVDDFDKFDKIYVMDQSNYANVIALARSEDDKKKVDLLLNVSSPGMNAAVPDPWYDEKQFEPVYLMIREACEIIFNQLQKNN